MLTEEGQTQLLDVDGGVVWAPALGSFALSSGFTLCINGNGSLVLRSKASSTPVWTSSYTLPALFEPPFSLIVESSCEVKVLDGGCGTLYSSFAAELQAAKKQKKPGSTVGAALQTVHWWLQCHRSSQPACWAACLFSTIHAAASGGSRPEWQRQDASSCSIQEEDRGAQPLARHQGH